MRLKWLGILIGSPLFAATYNVTAVRVLGTTATATSACATANACDGTVIEVDTSSSMATGGVYSLGFSQSDNNGTSNARIVLTVTGTGYSDCSGVPGPVTRTLYGTRQLRQAFPNAALNDETSGGGTLTLRFFLSDAIYTGETATLSLQAGVYTAGADSTAAYSGTVVNNSTLAYSKARTIANWSGVGWQRVTGSAFPVRAVAFQRHGMNGRPVACVVFTASDQHSHTVTVEVPRPTVDIQSPYGDRAAVTEYIGAIPTAGLDQGDRITVHFVAYPWVGNAAAAMNTADGVNAQPTPLYAPQYYVLDKTGAYGSAVSVVDPAGSDSNACAVTEAAFNAQSPPPACLTINGAAAKMVALNNSSFGRAEASGTMYLKAGTYNWTGASAAIGNTTANAWLTITPFPGVAKAAAIIGGQSGLQGFGTRCTTGSTNCGTPVRLAGLTVNVTSTPTSVFNNVTYLWLDGVTISANGTAPVFSVTIVYATGNQITTLSNGLGAFSTQNSAWALQRGNDLSGATVVHAYTTLGNSNATAHELRLITEFASTGAPSLAPIVAFNKLYRLSVSSAPALNMFQLGAGIPIGAAIVQNVFENVSAGNTLVVAVSSDGSTTTPVNNVMLWHNTVVGGRVNRCYNDNGTVVRLRNLWSEAGEVRDQEAIKADTFAPANAARIGNWSCLYGVGRRKVLNTELTGLAASGSFQMEFGGLGSYNPAITGSQPPASGTNAAGFPQFVARASYDGASAGAGNGDYRLMSNSPAVRMGGGVLPYDLNGVARRAMNGSGGAFEQATLHTPVFF